MEYYMCRCLEFLSSFLTTNTIDKNSHECVICLEKHRDADELLHINKYICERKCKCNYYIHKKCFHQWFSSRYADHNNNNNMNCIVCNSTGKLNSHLCNNIIGNNDNFCEMLVLFLYYYMH